MLRNYTCLKCGKVNLFFDDEVVEDTESKQFCSKKGCENCGSSKYEKAKESNVNTVSGVNLYGAPVTYFDSMPSRDDAYAERLREIKDENEGIQFHKSQRDNN